MDLHVIPRRSSTSSSKRAVTAVTAKHLKVKSLRCARVASTLVGVAGVVSHRSSDLGLRISMRNVWVSDPDRGRPISSDSFDTLF